MKKVEKVSIGRYAFALEEEACNDLRSYLEALRKHYSGNADCNEIVAAFEDRMAELLLENHTDESVVTSADVDAIKARIGAPESFDDADEQAGNGETAKAKESSDEWWKNDSAKKMFRPREGRFIGGVAAALSNRFNVDIVLVRIIWIVAAIVSFSISDRWWDPAFPVVLLAYLILWICIPSANGRQEMLNTGNKRERNGFWVLMGNILRVCFGGVMVLTGLFGIATGVMLCCGLTLTDLGNIWTELSTEMALNMPEGMISALSGITAKIVIGLCYFIPFILLLYEGLKICFEFKSPKWHPGLILSFIWFIALIAACIIMAGAIIPTLTI